MKKLGVFVLFSLLCLDRAESQLISCANGKTPSFYFGEFYSIEKGIEISTLINKDQIWIMNIATKTYLYKADCVEYVPDNSTIDNLGRFSSKVLFYDRPSSCYFCMEMYFRTTNILQYRESTCVTGPAPGFQVDRPTLENVCYDILPNEELLTMFKTTIDIINCKQTFEGIFQFSYEQDFGGGGICNSTSSVINACQLPGSPYVDNQVFYMNWGRCPNVQGTENKQIRFQCMGRWMDTNENIFMAVADLGQEIQRFRFRCLLTRTDQQMEDNKRRYSMSMWAQCSNLKSPYDGDIRLIMLPALGAAQTVPPTCNFPRNFTGTWFTVGEFDMRVIVNATHIYFKTKIDQYTYKETYYVCQQTVDTRYLTTAVVVGRCEVDFVCFDFMPRHDNIIRWRMGRPYRVTTESYQSNFLWQNFYQACTWSSFTFDRNKAAWKYNVFILDPPAPIICPIGGRYSFAQIGDPWEKYYTRIRGITERPRHKIDCHEYISEFKSCDDNPKKLYVDAEYCNSVDHNARPISEYDIPDREHTCAGYWLEDMKSYMITYDEEDPISKFRCWVYERLDWRDIVLSRATRGACGVNQTAYSYLPSEGASLHLILKEDERLWDQCPQRFTTGSNPYQKVLTISVVSSASRVWSVYTCIVLLLTTALSTL